MALFLTVACNIDNGYDDRVDSYRLQEYAEKLMRDRVEEDAYGLIDFLKVDCFLQASEEARDTLPQIKYDLPWFNLLDEHTVQLGLNGTVYYSYGEPFITNDCKWEISVGPAGDKMDIGYAYQGDSTWLCTASESTLRFRGWSDKGRAIVDICPQAVEDKSFDGSLSATLTITDGGVFRIISGEYSEGSYRVEIFREGSLTDWVEAHYSSSGAIFETSRD